MAASIVIHDEQEEVEIPGGIRTLAEFRRWLHSDAFPERGRIDYLDGRIEVDLAPRELFTHGAPKCTLITHLLETERSEDSGYLFMDARVACPQVNLSVAPDIVFVSYDAVDSGRTTFVPAPGGRRVALRSRERPTSLWRSWPTAHS